MYYIRYRRNPRNAVRIHYDSCWVAAPERRADAMTPWFGPFTWESAVEFAKDRGRPVVHGCHYCGTQP